MKVTSWWAMLIQWIGNLAPEARRLKACNGNAAANRHHTSLPQIFLFLPPFSYQTCDADLSNEIA